MSKRYLMTLCVAALLAIGTATPTLAEAQIVRLVSSEHGLENDNGHSSSGQLKIILHVGETAGWTHTLSNLKNLTNQYPNVKVQVLADGTSVYALQNNTDVVQALAAFAADGVDVRVCHNALVNHDIANSEMPSYVTIVPSGVIDLANSQQEGYKYVKP